MTTSSSVLSDVGPNQYNRPRGHVVAAARARSAASGQGVVCQPFTDNAARCSRWFSRYYLGALTAPEGVGPRGSSRSSMHFLRKASRASLCSRCWSAPNVQVAIFCFASTAKHGRAGKSTIRAATRIAQRDMINPPAHSDWNKLSDHPASFLRTNRDS